MADEYQDPSGNTQAFRAFAERPAEPAEEVRSHLPLMIGAGVAVLVIVIILVLLLLG